MADFYFSDRAARPIGPKTPHVRRVRAFFVGCRMGYRLQCFATWANLGDEHLLWLAHAADR